MNFYNCIPSASFLFLLIIIAGRIIFLRQKGVRVSLGKRINKKGVIFIYPVFLLLFLLWLYEIAKPAFQFSFSVLPKFFTHILFDSLFLKISGILIITISLTFLLLSLIHFKNSLRFGMNSNNLGNLITTGIFSVSRNPFFVSIEIYFIGIAFLITNLFFIAIALSTIINIHLFILKEEKFMQQNYGEEYEKFNRKVRRYF